MSLYIRNNRNLKKMETTVTVIDYCECYDFFAEKMPKIYFSGLSASKLVSDELNDKKMSISKTDHFIALPNENISDIEIGWDYFLIWKTNLKSQLYISGNDTVTDPGNIIRLLEMPTPSIRFKQVIAGLEKVTALMDNNEIWIYEIYKDKWQKIPNFIISSGENEKEYIVKIARGRCTVALTNFGQAFSIPSLLSNEDSIKFIDVACGYDHVLLLAANGNIYSTGMGTRGQLGHGDLEYCDQIRVIEALAGLKVVQISASGWHNAVITNQGDLYTWGWNNKGQLGHSAIGNVVAVPTLVEFKNGHEKLVELHVKKVDCGNAFTICKTDAGELWGCGSNKYGQLGQPRKDFPLFKNFVALNISHFTESVQDFKCREWSTCIYTA